MKWKQWKGYSYRLIGLVLGGLRQLVGQARQAKHCDGFRRGVILEWVVPGLPVTTNKLGVASASNAAGSDEFGAGVHVRVLGGQIPLKYAGREITGQSQRQHYIGDRMEEDVQMVSAGFALPMTSSKYCKNRKWCVSQVRRVWCAIPLSGCITNVRYYPVH